MTRFAGSLLFPECFTEAEMKRMNRPPSLRFVIQLHHATRLHFDFRLELSGKLLSWVLPLGPSLRPGQWREAIRVQYHGMFSLKPHSKRLIPPGRYGAGPILTWDIGHYCLRGNTGRKANTAAMYAGLEKGALSLMLQGETLNGAFTLFREPFWKPGKWVLFKEQDEFAVDTDVTQDRRSVLTGKTLDQIRTQNHTTCQQHIPTITSVNHQLPADSSC